jgi:hypothetical protein
MTALRLLLCLSLTFNSAGAALGKPVREHRLTGTRLPSNAAPTLPDDWRPFVLNLSCPVFFHCNTDTAGLGDMLEHYVFCAHLAKMFGARLVVA